MGEKGKTIEMGEKEGVESISGGKVVPVALMKIARERRRKGENQRWASWSTEETPWRWQARADALAGQLRMAWQNVSGSSPQGWQSG